MKKRIIACLLVLVLVVSCVAVFASCKNDKKLVGFDTELAEAVASELGVKAKFVEIDWDSKETMLEAGTIDVVWNGFTYTEARDNGYYDEERKAQIGGLDFTEYYMENKQVAVVKKNKKVTYEGNASFQGKSGCAEASSAGETVVKETLGCSCAQLGKQLDVFTGVTAGNYDFGVIDLTMASEYVASENGAYHDTLAIVELEGVEVEYYAVAVKEGSNLREALNYALKKTYENNTAQTLAEKYFLSENLYEGFTGDYTLPTTGATKAIQDKGTIVIGYTIFAPMNYFEK